MFRTCDDGLVRPVDLSDRTDPSALYVRSYLGIRAAVGFLGIGLPVLLIVGEWLLLPGPGVRVRGSLSAYYHSPMRDWFVGALAVIGFLLITYLAGRPNRPDRWLSTVAGVAVLGVVLFPTNRPLLTDSSPRCGSEPEPAGCSPFQQYFGETFVAAVHFACALVFIACLAAISFYFGCRATVGEHPRAALVHRQCGHAILAALGWIAIGGLLDADLGPLTPLYVGEIASVWAFAISWLVAARDLLAEKARPDRTTR